MNAYVAENVTDVAQNLLATFVQVDTNVAEATLTGRSVRLEGQ